MRRTLTWKLGVIIVITIILSVCITSIATYKTAYDKIYDAAGIEAYGCANITTGLLQPAEVERMLQGDTVTSKNVSDRLNWTTDHKAIFNTQYILDPNGKILALDNHLKEKGFTIGDSFYMDKEAIQMLKDMRHPTYSSLYEYGGMKRLSGYAPIFKDHDPKKEIIAISVIDFDGNIVTERTWTVVKNGILLGLIPTILASIITVLLIRRRTKPISELIEHARKIADGQLSVEDIHVNNNDEIGDLAHTLNMMTGNLRTIISTLKDTSENLTQNAKDTAASLEEMNVALQQVSKSIEEVASDTSTGTEGALAATNALTNLAHLIQEAKEAADDGVKNSTVTMNAAEQGTIKLNEITARMSKIKSATLDTEKTITQLNAYTTEIRTITETITGIAAQTNLLALNASIEAARAGEHGKGFAVVADEVRKLAEQSNQEVAEVEKLVAQIMASIAQTVGSVRESRQIVEDGEQTVADTSVALEQILAAVNRTVEEVKTISALANQEAATSEQIVELVSGLAMSIENMAANSQEVAAAAEETSSSIGGIAARSTKTNVAAQQLYDIVAKFKL